jgi:membrane fusion protein (multidrug efflux system)
MKPAPANPFVEDDAESLALSRNVIFDRCISPRFPAILAFLSALLLSSCARHDESSRQHAASTEKSSSAQAPPVSVKVVQPTRGDINRFVSLPALIAPNQQAALFAKVAGYLKTISVDKGDPVKQGDLLAEIEAPELIADAKKIKADLALAEIDYKRTTEAQQKAPDLVVLQSVDTAKAKYLAAKAMLERADTLLSFCKIIAPFSGVITKRFADPGAFVPAGSAGSAQSAALLVLADLSVVRLQVAIPEPEVPLIHKGLSAIVSIDELAGKTYSATLSRASGALDETRTMLVEFDLPNPKQELLPGMYANAKIAVEQHRQTTVLPVDAVVVDKAGASVFLVESGRARRMPVKTGFNDGKMVEILDGLSPDAPVILVGKLSLNNGQPIAIEEK